MIVRTGNIIDPFGLSSEEQTRRVAFTDQWRRGNNIYVTSEARCCLLLAAHNEITREGLLGHFSAIAGDWGKKVHPVKARYEGVDAFLAAVNATPALGALASTTVWLGGTRAQWYNVRPDDTEFERNYALQKL